VPVSSKQLKGLDSLLSIVQMPAGVPVATFAIGEAGATNAALHAAAILALSDPALAKRLAAFRDAQTTRVLGLTLPEPS
jgi:5-(carboxyamino)imidazole ribonucleotide mutase